MGVLRFHDVACAGVLDDPRSIAPDGTDDWSTCGKVGLQLGWQSAGEEGAVPE